MAGVAGNWRRASRYFFHRLGVFRVFAKTAMTLFIYFMRRLGYATVFCG